MASSTTDHAASDANLVSAIAKAEAQVAPLIQAFLTNSVPDAGTVVCRCPLFKAGKPIAGYASVHDAAHPNDSTSWKEIVITENFTIKLHITIPDEAAIAKKPGKAPAKFLMEWCSPLTSIIGAVPIDSASGKVEPHHNDGDSVFCVLFMCSKGSKPDKPGAYNYRDVALLAGLAHQKNDADVAAAERHHLEHLHTLSSPSLRCRAYVVPAVLGGAAVRDTWISAYNTRILASWSRRLLLSTTHHPSSVIFVGAAEAEIVPPAASGSTGDGEAVAANVISWVVVLENKSVAIVPMVAGGALACTARPLPDPAQHGGVWLQAPLQVQAASAITKNRVSIIDASSGRAVAQAAFFANAHAAAFEASLKK